MSDIPNRETFASMYSDILKEFSFSAGGPKAWFAVAKRNP